MTPLHGPERVVTASRDIAATAAEIFEFIADPSQQPRWDGNDNLLKRRPDNESRPSATSSS